MGFCEKILNAENLGSHREKNRHAAGSNKFNCQISQPRYDIELYLAVAAKLQLYDKLFMISQPKHAVTYLSMDATILELENF